MALLADLKSLITVFRSFRAKSPSNRVTLSITGVSIALPLQVTQGGASLDLPWRTFQGEHLPSPAHFEYSDRRSEGAATAGGRVAFSGALIFSPQAETFQMLSSSIIYDGLACASGFAKGLYVLQGHVCLEKPKSTPIAPGAPFGMAASAASRINFLLFSVYVSMHASLWSTVLH